MNFVVVGDDLAALELVRAIRASNDDRIVGAALAAKLQPEIARLAPDARITSRWDEFLTDASIDAVVVAGTNPEALDAAKQFAAAGKSLLLMPRAAHGSALLYELSLVRDDTGVLLFPWLPARHDREADVLADAIGSGRLGKLLYLEFTRTRSADATPGTVLLLTQSEIDEALLQDVDLLRRLGGDYNQVTALHTGAGSGGIATATVTLAGTEIPQATWMMKGSSSPSQWQLKVTGEKWSATLAAQENSASALRLELSEESQTDQKPLVPTSNPAERGAAILARFRAANDGTAPSRDWSDLIRAMEIVEATHRSIRRRRTIDLHFESTSERSLFKTQMTAIGCGVMSITFFAVVVLLLATAVFDVRDRQQIESERAGAVITRDEFSGGEAELAQEGIDHLEKLVPRIPAGRFSVLVEQTASDPGLDERRRVVVVTALRDRGVHDAELRTATAELKGRWFAGLLRIARIVVFAPLFLYLLLQLLLVLTRPATK